MARLAAGVAVLTTRDAEGRPKGFTATSVTPYSVDPPSVLACVARQATSYESLTTSRYFAVHLLAAGQEDLASDFARSDDSKFDRHAWQPSLGGVPVLAGAMSAFVCSQDRVWEHGDHAIVVGRVEQLEVQAIAPLVYYGRRFHPLPAEVPPLPEPSQAELLKLIYLS
jgi:flavin reductase (DIM6/NTAB) family NADH-FMN oxidoreductase RutF